MIVLNEHSIKREKISQQKKVGHEKKRIELKTCGWPWTTKKHFWLWTRRLRYGDFLSKVDW